MVAKLSFLQQILFLRLFCRMRNRSLVSEREFTRLVGRSILGSLTFVCISADQCTTSLDEEKMSSNGSANVKHSEAMSDEIVTAMSTACGASIFLFELLQKNLESICCPSYEMNAGSWQA